MAEWNAQAAYATAGNVDQLLESIETYVDSWSAEKEYRFGFNLDQKQGHIRSLLGAWIEKSREAKDAVGENKARKEAVCLIIQKLIAEYAALEPEQLVDEFVDEARAANRLMKKTGTHQNINITRAQYEKKHGKNEKKLSAQHEKLEMLRKVLGEIKASEPESYKEVYALLLKAKSQTELKDLFLTIQNLESRVLDYVDLKRDILGKLDDMVRMRAHADNRISWKRLPQDRPGQSHGPPARHQRH